MAQATLESNQAFSSVFNSSVPQRPVVKSALRSYGGRPLGPTSYNPPTPEWMRDPERESSVFASKTQKSSIKKMLTSDIDFLNKPELLHKVHGDVPGSLGYSWPRKSHEINIGRSGDELVDRWYDADVGAKQTLATNVQRSPRKYASSFSSASKRFSQTRQTHELGPGAYEIPIVAVQVKDAKRESYAFKSLTSTGFVAPKANEAPDMIQSSQYADLAKHWTSKGLPFSTRERFPRQRVRWSQF